MDFIEYIRNIYPEFEYKLIKKSSNITSFILNNNKNIIGVILQNGDILKTLAPLDVNNYSKKNLDKIINKLPTVITIGEGEFVFNGEIGEKKIIKKIKYFINGSNAKKNNYKIFYDYNSKNFIRIKNKYSDNIKTEIYNIWKDMIKQLNEMKNKIMFDNFKLHEIIDKYDIEINNYIEQDEVDSQDLIKLSKKIESEQVQLFDILEKILNMSDKELIGINDEKIIEISQKYNEHQILQKKINILKEQLINIFDKYSLENLRIKQEKYKYKKYRDKILNNKESFIKELEEFKKNLIEWCYDKKCNNLETQKEILINEIMELKNKFKFILNIFKDDIDYIKLKENTNDIILELKTSLISQFSEINKLTKTEGVEKKLTKDEKSEFENVSLQFKRIYNDIYYDILKLENKWNLKLIKIIERMVIKINDLEKKYKGNEEQNLDLEREYKIELVRLNNYYLEKLELEKFGYDDYNKQHILDDILKIIDRIRLEEDKFINKLRELNFGDAEENNILTKIKIDLHNELNNTKEENNFKIDKDILKNELIQNDEAITSDKKENIFIEEFDEIKKMLMKNLKRRIETNIDYNNSSELLNLLIELNNIFATKQKIITSLNKIIQKNIISFSCDERLKIKTKLEKIGQDVQKYINFMDLKNHVDNHNLLLKTNDEHAKEDINNDFYKNMVSLHQLWLENLDVFIQNEKELFTLYETISKFIRVYIKINTVRDIGSISKLLILDKYISIECGDIKGKYGEFFDIFNEKKSWLEIYSGIENSLKETERGTNGLYEIFDKLYTGNDLVIFKYGNSKLKPYNALIQYGLRGLHNIKNIELENLFEIGLSSLNIKDTIINLNGKIINLIGKIGVENSNTYTEDEFIENLPDDLKIENIKPENLDDLSKYIYNWRIKNKRISETPISQETTKTYLVSIFKLIFDNGNIVRLKLFDFPQHSSPKRLFNKVFHQSENFKKRNDLGYILKKGANWVEKMGLIRNKFEYLYPDDIINYLHENIYLNESINHIKFYLKKRLGKNIDIKPNDIYSYNKYKFFHDPQISNEEGFKTSKILMIPILKLLDKDFQSSCNFIFDINQEEIYCKDTEEILDFAQSLI